ncbi:hypothetical protein EYS14_05100 [Alteromonadaceae bacterium M269]|nr:hypothetical protein EYS14_05100 [Alteromonadaceae bacterium M269]
MPIHSAILRVVHGLNAIAVLGLISSGWAIYNAAPFLPFTFPVSISLGGYLTEALRWHFMLVWLFIITTTLFIVLRLSPLSPYYGPSLFPISYKAIQRDLVQALTFKLKHKLGQYNHIQRFLYVTVLLSFSVLFLSGFGLWKPVQLQPFNHIVGGYESMRRVHFGAMAVIASFSVIHLIMVLLVPKTLLSMLFGLQNNATQVKSPDIDSLLLKSRENEY